MENKSKFDEALSHFSVKKLPKASGFGEINRELEALKEIDLSGTTEHDYSDIPEELLKYAPKKPEPQKVDLYETFAPKVDDTELDPLSQSLMMQKPRTYEPPAQTKPETVTPPELSLDGIDDKPRKKSKFEMDMEKFGSADAVKAAKEKEEADKIRTRFNQDDLAKEPPQKERMTYNASKKANASLNTREDEIDEDFLAQQYAAKFLSENVTDETVTEPPQEFKPPKITENTKSELPKVSTFTTNLTSTEKIQADSAAKTMLAGLNQFESKQNSNNNLPRVSDLTDNMSDEDKRLANFGKRGALSNEEKADLKRMQTYELQKKMGSNHGISKKMEATLEAEKRLRKARKGRIVTYIGAVLGVLSGLIVLLLAGSDNLIITGFSLGQVIVSLLLFVRVRLIKRITLLFSLANAVILIFPGLLGYQQNTDLPEIKIIIFYAAAIAAVFLSVFLISMSPAVKLYYDIDFREEKSKL
ncbi:MAG: hypothetical protein LBM87_01610 [Ruminococcus sp.]|jgi:hypothetical protein|nr:hypothetical protein [Ruminococcus sp.]